MPVRSVEEIERYVATLPQTASLSRSPITPWHNKLRARYGWYHRWHLWPFANTLHWLIFFGLLFLTARTTYGAVRVAGNSTLVIAPDAVMFDTNSIAASGSMTASDKSLDTIGNPNVSQGANIVSPIGIDSSPQNPASVNTPSNSADDPASIDDTKNPSELPLEDSEGTGDVENTTEELVDWSTLVVDLDVFNTKSNEAVIKLPEFKDGDGNIDQQNIDNLFAFLAGDGSDELAVAVKRDKKKLGNLTGYNKNKKIVGIDTGKQTQDIELLKIGSLKGMELETKTKKIKDPKEKRGDAMAL